MQGSEMSAFPVNIEVRLPEFEDSDESEEDSVDMSDEDSDEGDESEFNIVLQYRVDQFQELFQTMSLKQQQLKKIKDENAHLVSMNEGLREKLAVVQNPNSGGYLHEESGPRKKSRTYKPETPNKEFLDMDDVIDLDDNLQYRSIDMGTLTPECVKPSSFGVAESSTSSGKAPMPAGNGQPLPAPTSVAPPPRQNSIPGPRPPAISVDTIPEDDEMPTKISHTRSMTEDKVITPTSATRSFQHRRSLSQPALDIVDPTTVFQPEMHLFKKKDKGLQRSKSSRAVLSSARAPVVEDKKWRSQVETSLQKLKEMHNDVRKSVEITRERVLNVGVDTSVAMLERTGLHPLS